MMTYFRAFVVLTIMTFVLLVGGISAAAGLVYGFILLGNYFHTIFGTEIAVILILLIVMFISSMIISFLYVYF